MPERRSQTIDSIEALQKVVPLIVKAVNDDQAFGLRAAANPLLAAEELGYQIAPEIRQTAERRVRFSQEDATRLGELAAQVYKLASVQFDIDSPQELNRILFEKLKLKRPTSPQQTAPDSYRKLASAPPATVGTTQTADPLEELRDAHPIMPPLLEYRRIDRSAPRLAPRELYERIRSGEVKMPITRIQARLKRSRTPK